MPTRHSPTARHRRLTGFILLSILLHALLWGWRPTSSTLTLTIPASSLAVALSTQTHQASIPQRVPEPISAPRHPVTAHSSIFEPAPKVPAAAVASDAVTNHLHSLLHDSLNRHFVYPAMARRLGWEGRVELWVRLNPDGRLDGLRVLHSSGYPLLDDDALQTLQRIGSIPQARAWLPKQGYATTLPVVYKLKEG